MDEAEQKVRAALGRLKVFPLPAGVLLPGSVLGLHVFEPRYRALAGDALASDGVLAVPMLAASQPGGPAPAALLPIAGAGVIERHERLADGRLNLLVRGVLRVELVAELESERPYRELKARALREPEARRHPPQADTLRGCVLSLCRSLPRELSEPLAATAAGLADAGQLCDAAAAALIPDPSVRQAVLEAVDVEERVQLVLSELARLLADATGSDQGPQFLA